MPQPGSDSPTLASDSDRGRSTLISHHPLFPDRHTCVSTAPVRSAPNPTSALPKPKPKPHLNAGPNPTP